jgi:UDP-glucose 4-epimerase
MMKDKTVLITGGAGSLGKALVRRLLVGDFGVPAKVIVFSRDESKQHQMRVEYLNKKRTTEDILFNNFKNMIEFRVGDIRDYSSVLRALRGVDYVIHAAAMKQVPTCEYFPHEALLTNSIGPNNLIHAIEEHDIPVQKVVAVGTDKACKPVNMMGITKAAQEKSFIAANVTSRQTVYCCVRYGNVLGSRGSVIPLFQDQLRAGAPLTVTNALMTRFLMTMDEAVELVMYALANALPGDIVIPKCPSASVGDLARAMAPDDTYPVEYIGERPGEKLHEIFISEEEIHRVSEQGKYYSIAPSLPELLDGRRQTLSPLRREFSSADYLLNTEQVRDFLQRNNLRPVS